MGFQALRTDRTLSLASPAHKATLLAREVYFKTTPTIAIFRKSTLNVNTRDRPKLIGAIHLVFWTDFTIFLYYFSLGFLFSLHNEVCQIPDEERCFGQRAKAYWPFLKILTITFVYEAILGFRWVEYKLNSILLNSNVIMLLCKEFERHNVSILISVSCTLIERDVIACFASLQNNRW